MYSKIYEKASPVSQLRQHGQKWTWTLQTCILVMTAPQTVWVWCSVNTKHKRTFWIEMVFFWKAVYLLHSRAQTLKVVDDPADGLNVGVLGLPFIMAAVVATFHHIHPTPEVWLLIHHPAECGHITIQRLLWSQSCSFDFDAVTVLGVRLTRHRRKPWLSWYSSWRTLGSAGMECHHRSPHTDRRSYSHRTARYDNVLHAEGGIETP